MEEILLERDERGWRQGEVSWIFAAGDCNAPARGQATAAGQQRRRGRRSNKTARPARLSSAHRRLPAGGCGGKSASDYAATNDERPRSKTRAHRSCNDVHRDGNAHKLRRRNPSLWRRKPSCPLSTVRASHLLLPQAELGSKKLVSGHSFKQISRSFKAQLPPLTPAAGFLRLAPLPSPHPSAPSLSGR